jgi:hypothetical protein
MCKPHQSSRCVSLEESPGPDFFLHHDFDISVVVDLVLFVFFALGVLPASAGRAVGEVDSAVFAVEFWHLILVDVRFIRVFLIICPEERPLF